jgi:hypothetical protein
MSLKIVTAACGTTRSSHVIIRTDKSKKVNNNVIKQKINHITYDHLYDHRPECL